MAIQFDLMSLMGSSCRRVAGCGARLVLAVIVAAGVGAFGVAGAASAVVAPTVTTVAIDPNAYTSMGVFDATGNFFAINQGNRTISKITPAGVLTAAWVTLPPGWQSNTIAIDASGNLYTPHENSNVVAKVTAAGVVNGSWATLTPGNAGQGIAVDGAGNVYVTNQGNHTVSKILPDGTATPAWVSLPPGSMPWGLVFDADGDLFVSNRQSGDISKIDPAGNLTAAWASIGANTWPANMVFDSDGDLYVAVFDGNRVAKVAPDATVTQSWSSVTKPLGITVDDDDNVLVSSYAGTDVYQVTPDGTKTTYASLPGGAGSMALAFNADGALYSSNSDGGSVSIIAPPPLTGTTISLGGVSIAPYTGVFDSAGNFYVSNERGPTFMHPEWIPTILKVTPAGVVSQFAVMAHGGIEGLAIDSAGNLYAANPGASAVSKIAADGTVTQNWAPMPNNSSPLGIVLSPDGTTLYVTLSNSNAVVKITIDADAPGGRIIDTTWAPLPGGSYPFGLALDAADNLYVANSGNSTVSKVTPNGSNAPTVDGAWASLPGDPSFLAFDSQGSLFVPYWSGGTAQLDAAGQIVQTWMTNDQPLGIDIDSQDNVYVTGYMNGAVNKIDAQGLLHKNWGQAGALPTSATVSPTDDIYVTNNGDGTVTVIPADPSPPSAPTILTATPGDQQATLTFRPPTSTGHSAITDYEVSIDGGSTWSTVTTSAGQNGYRTATLSSLTNGVTYTVQIRAKNAIGSSVASNSRSVTPAVPVPGTPTAPTAVAGVNSATVSWSAPSNTGSAITGYRITPYKAGIAQPGVTFNSTATQQTLTGLSAGSSYTFTVAAINAAGTGTASPASNAVTPTAPAPAPQTPSPPATAPTVKASTSSITASWPAATGNITGYTAYASPGTSSCTTTSASDTSCVIGATAGTTYTVTVVARGPGGTSAPSPASVPVVPTAPIAAPTLPNDVPLTLTTDKGKLALAVPSQQIVVIGTGFAPYSTVTVTIYSTPTPLGTTVTDGNGNFSVPVTVPANLAAGSHTFLAAGVDPEGAPRKMALPVTVPPTKSGSTGSDTTTQKTTLPVPPGGSITLIDATNAPATTVTVAGQGTYALDATTGVITFVPVTGFTGTATAVTYRITDAVGSLVTGTYTAVVTKGGTDNPGPSPSTGTSKVTVTKLMVTRGAPARATLPVVVTFTSAIKGRNTVVLWSTVSGKRVILGTGRATMAAASRRAGVTVVLNPLGRAMAATPGGYPIAVAATTVPDTGRTLRASSRTRLILNQLTVPRSVYFTTDSSRISTAQQRYLAFLRTKLTGARSVTCIGRTDDRGNSAYTMRLGKRRATAVCQALTARLHIATSAISKGEANPTASNNTPAGMARNRRVDITIRY